MEATQLANTCWLWSLTCCGYTFQRLGLILSNIRKFRSVVHELHIHIELMLGENRRICYGVRSLA